MARKTDEERLQEIERKIEQEKAKKQQLERRLREKERKQRTRRLIQVGAIFESYFGFKEEGLHPEQAEKIALGISKHVKEQKGKLMQIDIEKSKEQNQVIYQEQEEGLITPETKNTDYQVNKGE